MSGYGFRILKVIPPTKHCGECVTKMYGDFGRYSFAMRQAKTYARAEPNRYFRVVARDPGNVKRDMVFRVYVYPFRPTKKKLGIY